MELSADDRSYIYAVIRRIVKDDDLAADATQDALLLAHRYRAQFRGDAAFRTWLYRIAVTTALGQLRRRRRSREDIGVDPATLAALADPRPSPEQLAATRQLAGRAHAALDAIAAEHRLLFLLKAADHSEPEIAAALGISVANVKIRTHRARQRLRRCS